MKISKPWGHRLGPCSTAGHFYDRPSFVAGTPRKTMPRLTLRVTKSHVCQIRPWRQKLHCPVLPTRASADRPAATRPPPTSETRSFVRAFASLARIATASSAPIAALAKAIARSKRA